MGNEKRNRIGPRSLRPTRIRKVVLNPSFGEFPRQLDSEHGRVFRISSRLPHNQGLFSLATILEKDRREDVVYRAEVTLGESPSMREWNIRSCTRIPLPGLEPFRQQE